MIHEVISVALEKSNSMPAEGITVFNLVEVTISLNSQASIRIVAVPIGYITNPEYTSSLENITSEN